MSQTITQIEDADVIINRPNEISKLDMLDFEYGDEILLHYNSQRKAGSEENILTTRRCTYVSHTAGGRYGSLTVEDGDQTISLDREMRREGDAFLLSRGSTRVIRLGYLRGVSKPV